MRTKTLLITAAIGAAAAVATQAQVYSVNAVGYINLTINQGFNIVANQLDAGDNTVASLLAGVPGGTTVYTFDTAAGYTINSYDADFEEWTDAAMELTPGMGFWVKAPSAITVTLVGEVPQGSLSLPLNAGFNLVSSIVPQAGLVSTDLGMPVEGGDTVYTFDTAAGYSIFAYDADFEEWTPSEPSVAVGQGFWVKSASTKSWDRNFSVND
ncbi:MAG: hypothetical protein H7A46_15015 [Verrucomicrobiales bacterium]|nr:hypothetical protein [Verrucomicrobiales bacterium]